MGFLGALGNGGVRGGFEAGDSRPSSGESSERRLRLQRLDAAEGRLHVVARPPRQRRAEGGYWHGRFAGLVEKRTAFTDSCDKTTADRDVHNVAQRGKATRGLG